MTRRGPFPGMDPWLERSEGDVHTRLVRGACDRLNDDLPRDLVARIRERLYAVVVRAGGRDRGTPGPPVRGRGRRDGAPRAVERGQVRHLLLGGARRPRG